MKLAAVEEYGLRVMLQIAGEPSLFLTIPEVASREGLTRAYVAKLMRLLHKAGFVESVRGQRGGYRLAGPPQEINLAKLFNAIGGRLYDKNFCRQHTGKRRFCVHDCDCSIRAVYVAVDTAVQGVLSQMKLSDLLCTERAMTAWAAAHMTLGSQGDLPSLPSHPCGTV